VSSTQNNSRNSASLLRRNSIKLMSSEFQILMYFLTVTREVRDIAAILFRPCWPSYKRMIVLNLIIGIGLLGIISDFGFLFFEQKLTKS